jgi:hypothetical protein
MTTKTTTVKGLGDQPGKGAALLGGVIADLGFTAMFAWAGGVALNKGFGVHVPFAGAWILLLVGLYVIQYVTGNVAQTWHNARVKADINLVAATMAVQEESRQKTTAELAGLLKDI